LPSACRLRRDALPMGRKSTCVWSVTMTAPDSLTEPTFSPAPGHTDDVLYAVTHRIGRVRLNRPRAINSLTGEMVTSMLAQLRAWADDDAVGAVFIDGAGEKGLCAGGDVRQVREAILAGKVEEAVGFWDVEYTLNGLIADYPKPYVAWMDGVVMGGGVGVSSHGSRRFVTERSKVAMPETIIGLFPDVGGLHLLSRAPGELGTHLALTGLPVTGADAVVLGLADELVDSGDKERVLADLAAELAGGDSPGGVTTPVDAAASELEAKRAWIDECYAGDDAATIIERLLAHPDPDAQAAGKIIGERSPHSVVVTLAGLRRARA